ncbi:MAG: NAD-binding protein [Desulfatibacillaceae bacterium]
MRNGKKTIAKAVLWTCAVGAVLVVGIVYFPREEATLGFWESIYYTLRLFILEHDLGHFPTHRPLVAAYFAAPVIAVSAAGAAIRYLFRYSPTLRTRWMSGHVVVCGVGRTGKLLAETLAARGMDVAGVDVGPPEVFEQWMETARVPMVWGDFHHRPVLERAGVRRARAVVFASGDDLANLEGVVGTCGWLPGVNPGCRLWAHIANERLARTAREAVSENGEARVHFFDTYRIAARRMLSLHFSPEARKGVKEVVFLGFGNFGRDLVELFLRDLGPDEDIAVRVIDSRPLDGELDGLVRDLGATAPVEFQQARIEQLRFGREEDRAYFLCTDDDIGNLAAAMALSERSCCSRVLVRMGTWPLPAISGRLGENRGVRFVNINELVARGLEGLPGLLGKDAPTSADPGIAADAPGPAPKNVPDVRPGPSGT